MRCHDGFTLDLYEVLCEIIKTYQHILKHIEIYWNFINTTYQRSARSFRFIGFIFTKQTAAGHHFDECLPRFARHVSLCRGGWNPWRCSKKGFARVLQKKNTFGQGIARWRLPATSLHPPKMHNPVATGRALNHEGFKKGETLFHGSTDLGGGTPQFLRGEKHGSTNRSNRRDTSGSWGLYRQESKYIYYTR